MIIQRLCRQLIENHKDFSSTILIGLQPRGVFFMERIVEEFAKSGHVVKWGIVDPTFYRDDFRIHDKPLLAKSTDMKHSVEGMNVVLIDRKKGREVPIEATYVGKEVESFDNQRVRVMWKSEGEKEDHVIFLND